MGLVPIKLKFCTYMSCIHISNPLKTKCVQDTWKQLSKIVAGSPYLRQVVDP